MNLKKLLLAIVTFSTMALNAQDFGIEAFRGGEYYAGYVMDLNGKKTEGYIRFSDRVSIQSKVVFYLDKNNKKTKIKYNSKDLKEYKLADRLYRCVPYSGEMGKSTRGLYLIEDKCIEKYMFYELKQSEKSIDKRDTESMEEYKARIYPSWVVYKKKGTNLVKGEEYYLIGFVKKMLALIGDNAALSAKISNKEKGYKALSGDGTIEKIINEYNDACKM